MCKFYHMDYGIMFYNIIKYKTDKAFDIQTKRQHICIAATFGIS